MASHDKAVPGIIPQPAKNTDPRISPVVQTPQYLVGHPAARVFHQGNRRDAVFFDRKFVEILYLLNRNDLCGHNSYPISCKKALLSLQFFLLFT